MRTQMVTPVVALIALAASACPSVAAYYACAGTEPFWGMTLAGKASQFKIGDTTQKLRIVRSRTGRGVTRQYLEVFDARLGPQGRPVSIIIRGDSCSDGMSENVYAYSATILMPNDVYVGCCNIKP